MKIFYIRKKTMLTVAIIISVVILSFVYTRDLRTGAISVLLNNEKVMPIYSVDVPDKRVAITIDAAWGDQYIQDILVELKRYDIKATFFVVGSWVEKYPELVRDISNSGHEIGNHSMTHIKMTELPKSGMVSEIENAESCIQGITGKRTRLFRAPFGEYNDELISSALKMDYNMIQWDVDSLDWQGSDVKEVYDRVVSKVSGGSIVLFHSNTAVTPQVLPDIIEKLRDSGYKFATVSELIFKKNYYIDSTGRQKLLK